MKTTAIIAVLVSLLIFMACSRKADNPPKPKGDLEATFVVTDDYNALPDLIPVRVALYDDSLHLYEIGSKRFTTEPDVVHTAEFNGINARSSFYYLELKFDFGNALDTGCEYSIYIQEGQVRQEGLLVLEYWCDELGDTCILNCLRM